MLASMSITDRLAYYHGDLESYRDILQKRDPDNQYHVIWVVSGWMVSGYVVRETNVMFICHSEWHVFGITSRGGFHKTKVQWFKTPLEAVRVARQYQLDVVDELTENLNFNKGILESMDLFLADTNP